MEYIKAMGFGELQFPNNLDIDIIEPVKKIVPVGLQFPNNLDIDIITPDVITGPGGLQFPNNLDIDIIITVKD